MKIKIKLFDGQVMPEIIDKGDWIDLFANKNVSIREPYIETVINKEGKEKLKCKFDNAMIPLGVAMELPNGFEAHVLPKSSTYKKTKTILTNSMGIIDGVTYTGTIGYNGDDDQWFYNAIGMNSVSIKKGQPICQFRIMLSQKATVWQKLRWLFSNKIELVEVDKLNSVNRGGFGSTDKQLENIVNKNKSEDCK